MSALSNDSSDNSSIFVDLIRELDGLINHLREAARVGDQLASQKNSHPFDRLSQVLREIESASTRTASENVADVRSDFGSQVSGLLVLALTNCDGRQLTHHISAAQVEIASWNPTTPIANEKPDLNFGESAEVTAAWEMEEEGERQRHATDDACRRRILDAVGPVIELLDVTRRNIVDDRERHQNSIHRQPSGAFLVRFGDEIGVLTGEPATRLVQLIRLGRAGVETLTMDSARVESSRSVMSQPDGGEINHAFSQSIAQLLGGIDARNLRQVISHQLEDTELRLQANLPSDERERLETEREMLATYRNGIGRIPDSRIRACRNTIQQGWGRIANSLDVDMPQFAIHIRDCWRYDERVDEYVYEGPDWHFDGF